MIPVDARSEEFREAAASRGGFRSAESRSFFPACGAQCGNAREFVFFAQCIGTEIETTDAHTQTRIRKNQYPGKGTCNRIGSIRLI
jgi:hypothetical protein